MKLFWKIFSPILFLFILAVLFFLPYLISDKIPYVGDFTGSDLTELNLPLRFLASQSWQHGQMPLWTNLLAGGFPLLAEGQAGIFYPLNILLFTLLPFVLAVNLTFLLNFFLGEFFSYLYCRSLKISRFGSLLAAVAFSFSGFFIFRLKHLNYINAAIWLPLELFLIEKYFSAKKKNLILVILSLVFAVQFFAGSPPFFYVSLISAILYFGLKFIFNQQLTLKKIISSFILPWLVVGVIVFGLVAIQFFPTFFYSAASGRSLAVFYGQIISFPYPAFSLLYFISPYLFGNPSHNTFSQDLGTFGVFWENNIYFGLLPLFLALGAIIFLFNKNKTVRLLTILVFSAFLLIFGDFSPLFIIFWHFLPGLKMFRFPQRFLLLVLVALTTLAGFGFDFFWQKLKEWQQKTKIFSRSKLLVEFLLPFALILVVAVDLFLVAFNYVGFLDYNDYFSPPQSANFLKTDQEIFRIYSVDWPKIWQTVNRLSDGWQNNLALFISAREIIPPNLNVFWGLASAQDRASLEGGMLMKEYQQLTERLRNESWQVQEKDNSTKVFDQSLKIFGLQNVKYFLAFKNLENNNLSLVKTIKTDFLPPLKIYQNQYFLPAAFGVFSVKEVASKEEMLPLLFDQNFNPAKEIVLLKGSKRLALSSTTPKATTKIIEQNPGRWLIQADFSDNGYLFLSQVFVPGWQVKIDGQKKDLLLADAAFMTVVVPAGQHQVEFLFKPVYFSVGEVITFITLLALIIFFGYYLFSSLTSVKNLIF